MKIELPPPIPCKREAPKREQKPAISEAPHRAFPPPVPAPRPPKEAAREQAPSSTPPSFGNQRGNSSTWRLFGYVTAPAVCLLVVLAILSSLRSSSRTEPPRPGPSATPNASPTESPRPGPSPTPSASPTESPRPGPSPTPSASPTESPRTGPSPTPSASPTESPRTGPSPTPSASPTESPRPGPSATPNASPTESPRPGPSPTPSASPTESPRPGPSPTPKYRVKVPGGGFLNMRQGAGISFPIVQRLQHGVDGVTMIGKPVTNGSTRWQQISSRGVVGWVNADYLVPSHGGPSSEGLPPGLVWETWRVEVPSGGFLNMRQGAGISFPVVQRLQHGVDGVTMIGKPVTNGDTRWQKIQSRGVVGWVNADYLVPSRGGQDIPPTVLPAVSNVGPTSEGLPPGFVWETTPAPGATPIPVRRAIEQ